MRWILLLFWPFSGLCFAQTGRDIELQHERFPLGKPTALITQLELGHFHERIQDEDSQQQAFDRETNQLEARAKLGLRLWQGKGELLGVIGARKSIHTQKLLQKRPYIEFSLFPLVGKWGQITQYNIVQLPFSGVDVKGESDKPHLQGSIFTVGLAPTLVWKNRYDAIAFDIKLGGDLWTRLYSRDQLADSNQLGASLQGLQESEDRLIDTNSTWYSSAFLGVLLAPGYLRRGSLSLAAYTITRQFPFYEGPDQEIRYKVERSSYYQAKLKYAINSTLVASNELYLFYSDTFREAGDGKGQRLRNIFRMTFHL